MRAEIAHMRAELSPPSAKLPLAPAPLRIGRERSAQAGYLSTRGLAARFKALIAAARAHAPRAARLARRLQRQPDLARYFTRPPRDCIRVRPAPGHASLADAAAFARRAWRACDSS